MVARNENSKSSLGVRLRGQLAEAYGKRGHQKSDLWYVYSPRTGSDWVLHNDLEWAHYLLAESDAALRSVDYAPLVKESHLEATGFGKAINAIVVKKNGEIEWRELAYSRPNKVRAGGGFNERFKEITELARANGAIYVQLTEDSIYAHSQRLNNWVRILAWMAAARYHSLYNEKIQIATLLDSRGKVLLSDIMLMGEKTSLPLFIAATFKMVQEGDLMSDCNERPLTKNSVIMLPGV